MIEPVIPLDRSLQRNKAVFATSSMDMLRPNGAVAEGAEEAMKGRGGLRAQILSDGILRPEPVTA